MELNELLRNSQTTLKLLRLPDVQEITGLKKSSVYALVKSGEMPAPVRLRANGRAVAWRNDEISQWVASRVKADAGKSVLQGA